VDPGTSKRRAREQSNGYRNQDSLLSCFAPELQPQARIRQRIRQALSEAGEREEKRTVHEDVTKSPGASTTILVKVAPGPIQAPGLKVPCGARIREVLQQTAGRPAPIRRQCRLKRIINFYFSNTIINGALMDKRLKCLNTYPKRFSWLTRIFHSTRCTEPRIHTNSDQ
jgi:hypothetical protein